MRASASNRKTATISIDIGKNTSTWLGWTSAGQSCCVRMAQILAFARQKNDRRLLTYRARVAKARFEDWLRGWDLFKNVPGSSCESTFEDWLRGLEATYTEHDSITSENPENRSNLGPRP